MFVLQVALSLGLLLAAIHFQFKETELISRQPAMQESDARVRADIEAERDIERLRAAALYVQNASEISWNAVIGITKDLDTMVWAFCLSSIGMAIVGGCTVFAFRVRKPQLETELKPTATAN